MTSEAETAADRFTRTPRPLDFIRIRVYRGGQAEYLLALLEDEKETLFEDLGKARGEGKDESDPDIEEIRQNLRHLINILRDLSNGMIELAGPGGL